MRYEITVVIPNWNGAARLQRLLDSLKQQTQRPVQVLVVDNGSTDKSTAVADSAGATVLALGQNYGFARAVNLGVQRAQSGGVAILNNDVTLEPDCLQHLQAALADYSFSVPKILSAADPARIDGTYDLTSRGFCSWRAGHGSDATLPVWNRGTVIESAPLTAAVFRRSAFESAGGLDERFGSYLEDIDLGLRCAQRGLRGWYEPAAVARHEGSVTLGGAWSPRMVQLIARNQVLLARKYGYGGGVWPAVVGQLGWGWLALKHGAGKAWIQGKLEGYRLADPRLPTMTDLRPIPEILRSQERAMAGLMKEAGIRETFWSSYFRFCGEGVAE